MKENPIRLGRKGYKPDSHEANLVHVVLDKPLFNQKTGEKLSKEYIQKFTLSDWKVFKDYNQCLGYTIEVLYEPGV